MIMRIRVILLILNCKLFNLFAWFLLADVNQNHACNTVKEGGLAEELLAMEREWLRRKMEQEEVDREFARQLQEQLNRESNIPSVNRTKGSNDEYKLRSKSGKQTSIEDSFQRRPLRKSSP